MPNGRKKWAFTSFAIAVEPKFYSNLMHYMCFAKERGKIRGREHFQGFVYFKERRTLQYLTRFFPGCHWTQANGKIYTLLLFLKFIDLVYLLLIII